MAEVLEAEYEAKLDKLRKELREVTAKRRGTQSSWAAANEKSQELKKELEALYEEHEKLLTQCESYKEDREDLRQELKKYSENYEAEKRRHDLTCEELHDTRRACREYQLEINRLERLAYKREKLEGARVDTTHGAGIVTRVTTRIEVLLDTGHVYHVADPEDVELIGEPDILEAVTLREDLDQMRQETWVEITHNGDLEEITMKAAQQRLN